MNTSTSRNAVGAYIVNSKNEVLFLRRSRTESFGGLYEIPSGGVEAGETLAIALKREVLEETGLLVTSIDEHVSTLRYIDAPACVAQLNFLVRVEDIPAVVLSAEHDLARWIGVRDKPPGEFDGVAASLLMDLDAFLNRRPLVISLEGTDGSGKTTHTQLLANSLRRCNISSTAVEEFPSEFIGNFLNNLAATSPHLELVASRPTPVTQTLLVAAAQAFKAEAVVGALPADTVAVVDRFVDSCFAYQVSALEFAGVEKLVARQYLEQVLSMVKLPDLVIYLDRSEGAATDARAMRGDDLSKESSRFIRASRMELEDRLSHRNVVRLTVSGAVESTGAALLSKVVEWLTDHRPWLVEPAIPLPSMAD